MRLPLGILTRGRFHWRRNSVLKRGELITGVTTAATTMDYYGYRTMLWRRTIKALGVSCNHFFFHSALGIQMGGSFSFREIITHGF